MAATLSGQFTMSRLRLLQAVLVLSLVLLPIAFALLALGNGAWQWQASWWPATLASVTLTVLTSSVVLLATLLLLRRYADSRWLRALSSVIATPHLAFAVGLLWLLSPSGELLRLLHAWFGAWPQPPATWWLQEKSLLTLTLALILKELPFLLLMGLIYLRQMPAQRWLIQAQSLGWSARRSWWLLVVPALLPRLWLPLAAIAIYGLAVVDVALLVGPNTPALLAVELYQLNFEWQQQDAARSGAWLLFAVSLLGLLALRTSLPGLLQALQWCRWHSGKATARRNWRLLSWCSASRLLLWVALLISSLAVLGLVLQSVAGSWFYPQLLPNSWDPTRWLQEWPYLWPLAWRSWWLASLCALLSVAAAVAVLEWQRQQGDQRLRLLPLTLLLLPQLWLVLGWQQSFADLAGAPLVLWSHVAFAFPYAYLVLHGAWVHYPERWLIQAQSLGHSYLQAWCRVLLPMLRGPLAIAAVVAFSVSIAQYLPTLWLGAGQTPTLTTETVSIAAGGDWRLASLYSLAQTLLPLLWFVLWWRWQHHQGGAHARN